MVITGIEDKEQLIYEYNMKEGLEALTVNDLNDRKIKLINDMLRGDKRLSIENINNYSQVNKHSLNHKNNLMKHRL
jgi:hypothetical protein